MRRFTWNLLIAVVFLAAVAIGGCATPAMADEPLARGVGCIALTVSDADRAGDFYRHVLEFRREREVEVAGESWERLEGVFGMRARIVRLRLGGECLDLTEYLAPRGRPIPDDARSNDRSFQHVAIVVSDMDEAYRRLRAARVEHASSGPQRLPDWNPAAGGIRAFYFRDPDRHVLEVISFPPNKGDPRWHPTRPGGPLFLGIDHTAIVVADTDASLRFWRDVLGFRVAGTGENWGTEQEHLNNVFGARLRITTLRAVEGPGVELLEYLAPRDGRPYPADEHANDLLHWQTPVRVTDLDAAARAARGAGQGLISAGPVPVAEQELGFSRALLARDPDGHAVQLGVAPAHEARSTR
jgi:catechol 2,3-dioxygenase-like lactoylglutathione lyase family enzyme